MTGLLKRIVWALAICVGIPASAYASPVDSDPKAQAQRLSARAFEHFDQGEFEAGIGLLTQAFVAFPEPDLLLNRAVAYEQWGGHCADALDGYARYFEHCGGRTCANLDAARKREALYRERCRVPVTITSDPAGATVLDGDDGVGATPLTARLLPGTHRLTARLVGYREATRDVVVADGQPVTVTLKLEPVAASVVEAAAPAPVSPATADASEGDPLRTGAWVAFGVGGVAAITGTVFFFSHLDAREERNAKADDLSVSIARLRSIEDEANRDWVLAWTGFGIGAAGLATGAALFILSGNDAAATPLALQPAIGPGWASVSGRF